MADLALIKKLREITGCGISDCNKALKECSNNFDNSVDWLRKKGLSSAAKKSGRITAEGLVGLKIQDNKAVIIEVNSETDFVAKNNKFQNLVSELLSKSMLFNGDIDNFIKSEYKDGLLIEEEIKNQIGVIGENINLRKISKVSIDNGVIASYIHNIAAPDMGKIAVLVALESDADKSKLEDLGKKIAMHIAAAKPESLSVENVNKDKLDREVLILRDQAKSSGKPESIIEKMIEGRIRKYYDEVVLLEQFFVMDDKIKIKDIIANFSKEVGFKTTLSDYRLFILGEGVEKKENDFASEVASMTN